jgi:predicted heme/steroid binding protein
MVRNLLISVVVAVVIVAGAVVLRSNRSQESAGDTSAPVVTKSITKNELTEANGKDGKECLVAVDGTVYKVKQGFNWRDGQHKTSDGLAYCGADLSSAIDKAPHGRSKLSQLDKVGQLAN